MWKELSGSNLYFILLYLSANQSLTRSAHFHTSVWYNPLCVTVYYSQQSNRNVSRQSCKQNSDHQMNQAMWWSCLNTSLLAIISCLPLPPPSNQLSWLRADLIIINLLRRARDDWWEPRPNQWRMRDKCLPWRLWQRHLRWSGFSPH